jgi:hypothetical protein
VIVSVWRQRLTPFDRKLVTALTLLVLSSFLLPLQQAAGSRLVVSSGDNILFVAPLNQDQQFELSGPLGSTKLQISNGAVRVLSSPCPQKICIGMGQVSRSGELLACVPNRLVIRIEGESADRESGYDLLSR